ncbi:dithiol-disulfide isomerase [Haemophilus paracuniculus]|uniref:Dithiol-disulfide isomerase n=1 Tax=Haemophilus paracuniculus TaxID=734 RepID=A0A1T0AT20_9PAST|nr:DUF5377 family protein [Haemophilus paracuniculus]OOR99746.1 dithiol-disulfide isomerase [Haemophilus paracuniculus]
MSKQMLFSNHWNVRVSDPGEEGNVNHFFETVYLTLTAETQNGKTIYEFIRKVEDEIKIERQFDQVDLLFEFLGEYLSPVSLGNVGVKIGQLGLA